MSVPARTRGRLRVRARHSYITRTVVLPAQKYLHTESISGLLLLAAATAAIIWANSPWSAAYHRIWALPLGFSMGKFSIVKDLSHWINDGLMAAFFFSVGLEIKRELVTGHLAQPRRATLPVIAALGGMIVPALLYVGFTYGTDAVHGWGVPMATDIAFAVGTLALLGPRIPDELRVFLLALAVVDDIGAILVIAVFYTQSISESALVFAGAVVLLALGMRYIGVTRVWIYFGMGTLLWLALLKSGVHATIAGVIMGMLVPARPRLEHPEFHAAIDTLQERLRAATHAGNSEHEEATLGAMEELLTSTEPPVVRLQRAVHPVASLVVLPIFALANAGVPISASSLFGALTSRPGLGVAVGLVLGKLIGVTAFTALAVRSGAAELPPKVGWRQVIGVGLLAGIGFTVSLFITDLAFEESAVITSTKIAIMIASIVAALLGYAYLRVFNPQAAPAVLDASIDV
jgi:NhaA family Na+:H+ antiporter